MKAVVLDKIASVTRNCGVPKRVYLGGEFPCREGDVIAVRITNAKGTYNQLELESGRMSTLKPGDVVAGALGHRHALRGYAGRLPETLEVGDTVHILNLGGVLGICDSVSPEVGRPFECEVLGQVLSFPHVGKRVAEPTTICRNVLPLRPDADVSDVPVIVLVGTAMNCGKTAACAALIQQLTRRGLQVFGAKATGVSLRRDILLMEDSGAERSLIFTDFGVVTTSEGNAAPTCRAMLSHLAEGAPDVIVLELGDGLLGTYGVHAILDDAGLRASFARVVLAASDPVGAWGGVALLKQRYGLDASVVTGPATDNRAGTEVIEAACGTTAINARLHADRLAEHVLNGLEIAARGARVA